MSPSHLPIALLLALVAAVCAACGGSEPAAPTAPPSIELALDFTPNAVHAPIFAAVRTGQDRRNGVRVRIRDPGEGPDALRLVASGRVDVGLLDIHDLALAQARGVAVVGVGALVQRPLAALIAQPEIERPRELAGATVGVSGLPSDPAFLRAIVEADGGRYDRIRQVTIGFQAVPALLGRRVDAVPAFWNVEGVALERRGRRMRQFRVEDYGAPAYPEVVFITAPSTLERRRGAVEAALRAVAGGVREVLARPEPAVREIAAAARTDDLALVRAQLAAVSPLFTPPIRLDGEVLERWATWDARIGLVERRPDVRGLFDLTVAP